jgi:hypothetical protein
MTVIDPGIEDVIGRHRYVTIATHRQAMRVFLRAPRRGRLPRIRRLVLER